MWSSTITYSSLSFRCSNGLYLKNERKSLLRRSHAVLPSTNLTQHIIQPWGGASAKYGGAISQVWGGSSAKYGGDHQPSMGGSSTKYGGAISQVWGGHQPTMGGPSAKYGGGSIFPPVCTGSQNPENYFSNTYVLPSVNRTAGPKNQECIPVGCVPAAHWPYAGVCFPVWGGSPWQGGLLLGGCLLRGGVAASQHALRQTPQWTESQTRVKT